MVAESTPDKPVLFMNLDETALCCSFASLKGTVMCAKALPRGARLAPEKTSLADARGHVTHIGLVTHESETQPLLPQVI